MKVAQTIKTLGGASAVARMLGYPVTTVQSWQYNDRAPRWQMPLLERLLAEHNRQTMRRKAVGRKEEAADAPPSSRPRRPSRVAA